MFKKLTTTTQFKFILAITTTLAILFFSGCSIVSEVVPAQTKRIQINGTDFDTAYSKAMRACTDIGYIINITDKNSGTFSATNMAVLGLARADEINFVLDREGNNKLSASITIRSINGSEELNKFIAAYGKYVSIPK